MVELASFVVYVVDGFLVDADEHRVSQFDVFPLDESCFPFPSPCGELIGYQEAWADYRWFPSPYGV